MTARRRVAGCGAAGMGSCVFRCFTAPLALGRHVPMTGNLYAMALHVSDTPRSEAGLLVGAGLNYLPLPVLIVAANGTIQAINDSLLRQLGYSRDEVLRQPVDVVLPGGLPLPPAPEIRDGIESRRTGIARRKDGSRMPVSVSVNWLPSEAGTIAVAALIDSSERQRVEQEFQAALDRAVRFERLVSELTASFVDLPPEHVDGAIVRALHLLLDALELDRCLIFQIDDARDEFVLTHAATRPGLPAPALGMLATRDFPWSVAKIRAGEVAAFSSPDEIPDAVERESLVPYGTLSRATVPLRLRGRIAGAIAFVVARYHRTWGPELLGRFALVAEVFGGVLARRASDATLQSNELRFRTLCDNAPVMIWASGPDKLCTWVNRRWVEFVGRPIADALGTGWLAHMHPDDRAASAHVYEACFDARQPFTMEYRLRRDDGEWRWVLASGAPNVAPDGVFAGYLGTCVEVTEQKRAVQRAEQSRDDLHVENLYLRREVKDLLGAGGVVGRSASIAQVLEMIDQVAPTDSTVLLLGETGTGKEFLASRIHELSARRSRSMVRVNCAAIPATLIESELFGRDRGAFTGAMTRQIGRFEVADRSTIFLDEIGDLPLEVQVKLLRVLEERQFERLGSSTPIRIDTRIIAATHRNLEQRIREGTFREDLFYRLNVFPIVVPPLRERVEDIPILVWHFIDQFSASFGRRFESIPADNMAALQAYSWPGNIRELRNVVERAMILSTGAKLTIALPESSAAAAQTPSGRLVDVERDHIRKVLEATSWRIRGAGGAADRLGLAPTTLESRMAKLGLVRPAV